MLRYWWWSWGVFVEQQTYWMVQAALSQKYCVRWEEGGSSTGCIAVEINPTHEAELCWLRQVRLWQYTPVVSLGILVQVCWPFGVVFQLSRHASGIDTAMSPFQNTTLVEAKVILLRVVWAMIFDVYIGRRVWFMGCNCPSWWWLDFWSELTCIFHCTLVDATCNSNSSDMVWDWP